MKTENIILITFVAVVLVFLVATPFGMMSFGNYGWGMMSGFGGMFFLVPVIMILFITALVLLIIWLIKQIETGKK